MSPKSRPWTTSQTSRMQSVPNWTLDTPQEMAPLPLQLFRPHSLGCLLFLFDSSFRKQSECKHRLPHPTSLDHSSSISCSGYCKNPLTVLPTSILAPILVYSSHLNQRDPLKNQSDNFLPLLKLLQYLTISCKVKAQSFLSPTRLLADFLYVSPLTHWLQPHQFPCISWNTPDKGALRDSVPAVAPPSTWFTISFPLDPDSSSPSL